MSATYERRSGTPQASNYQFSGGNTITNDRAQHRTDRHHQPSAERICGTCASRSACDLGAGRRSKARFDFFNIFNANFVTSQTTRVGPSYLIPSGIILPRILQMGVTYEF